MRGAGMDHTPCPDRILDDMGSAFAMGAVGGSVWHGIKGMRNSPRGFRFSGGYQSMRLRAPTLGGNFAVWGGLFSTFDCTFTHIRKREDPWNSVAAGACTGGVLAARAGWKAMAKNAVIGGVLLGAIEGLGVLMSKWMGGAQEPPAAMMPPGHTPMTPPKDKRRADDMEGQFSTMQWDEDTQFGAMVGGAGADQQDDAFRHPLLERQRLRSQDISLSHSAQAGFSFPDNSEIDDDDYNFER